jgi:hypothetical protein
MDQLPMDVHIVLDESLENLTSDTKAIASTILKLK